MKKISVIIPTYNRVHYISKAIESVTAQTYTDWELIIIDDASTDNTHHVVKNYIENDMRIRYIRQPKNVGISRNRNTGIAVATGMYIAMLDSDDVWLDKEKLAKQVAFLEKNTEYALVGTWVRKIDQNGVPIGEMTFATDNRTIRQAILCRNQFVQSSVLFTKKAAEDVGLYNPVFVVNEDYDLWLSIGKKYKFANLPSFATGYRVHTGSIIRQKRLLAARLHLDIIKKYRYDYPRFGLAWCKGYIRLLIAMAGFNF